MSESSSIPDYLTLQQGQENISLNLDRQTYSQLARTTMSIVRGLDYTLAAYQLPQERGCTVDIFLVDRLLSIRIDNQAATLELLLSALDSPDPAFCILCLHKSPKAWAELLEVALQHRE